MLGVSWVSGMPPLVHNGYFSAQRLSLPLSRATASIRLNCKDPRLLKDPLCRLETNRVNQRRLRVEEEGSPAVGPGDHQRRYERRHERGVVLADGVAQQCGAVLDGVVAEHVLGEQRDALRAPVQKEDPSARSSALIKTVKRVSTSRTGK